MEKKIRIAVLCPSEIAFRRFMPALKKIDNIEYIGIAVANEIEWFGNISKSNNRNILNSEYEKALNFQKEYGGNIFKSYNELLTSNEIDAIYIPLPPALHFKWAQIALENNKHVFLEKPSTCSHIDSSKLVEMAKNNNLAIHENYMFMFHTQLEYILKLINDKTIGDVRLFRIAFGFPFRGNNDFRYNKKLGGGSLLDCGGYTIKLANKLLGETSKLICHKLNYKNDSEVDIYGSGTLINDNGIVAQISFGMDNSYKCELEVWGQIGTIYTNRIFTAPEGYKPIINIQKNNESQEIVLNSDDTFNKSIKYFINCIFNDKIRKESYKNILVQSKTIDEFMEK